MAKKKKVKGGKGSKSGSRPFGVGAAPRPGGSPKAQFATATGPGKNTNAPMPMQFRKPRGDR